VEKGFKDRDIDLLESSKELGDKVFNWVEKKGRKCKGIQFLRKSIL
jgi:hypothetical protein